MSAIPISTPESCTWFSRFMAGPAASARHMRSQTETVLLCMMGAQAGFPRAWASLFPGPGMFFFRPRDLFQPRKVFFLASVFFPASLRGPKKQKCLFDDPVRSRQRRNDRLFLNPAASCDRPRFFFRTPECFFFNLCRTHRASKRRCNMHCKRTGAVHNSKLQTLNPKTLNSESLNLKL